MSDVEKSKTDTGNSHNESRQNLHMTNQQIYITELHNKYFKCEILT